MNSTLAIPTSDNYTSNNNSPPGAPVVEPFGYQQAALVILLSIVIVIVVIGNTLVIAAVGTTRRLRTVTNCFVMSLAVADWLVGIFVMPPAVAYFIVGSWELGWVLCDIWVSLDILLCTASILSLCAISVDRYLAVTQPLSYSKKRRSKRLAFVMILIVWVSSALITAPPMFGWYEPGRHNQKTCRYNKNTGYVIFSAMGSFFIPMVVMLYVYVRISCVIAQRHDQLSHINTSYSRKSRQNGVNIEESDIERISGETEDVNPNGRSSSLVSGYRSKMLPETPRQSSTNLLKANTNYSFQNHRPLTPVRSFNNFRSSLPAKSPVEQQNHVDFIMLNYEPATRVSSFRRETKTAQTLSIVMGRWFHTLLASLFHLLFINSIYSTKSANHAIFYVVRMDQFSYQSVYLCFL
ncbi:hypothetical protein ABEB36_003543 [Hypothenemus hampei]|uniref:G-protein coupled receptors family 1 profile domain-containing protein n=1 Tax=Hypothenemus hampei TaxID=57062 RepID=A0ABD1F9H7_HYPHA